MIQVHEAVFTPDTDGGGMQATMQAGPRQITVTWPLENDDELRSLLDQVLARVEQISLLRTSDGIEIRASLTIAGRTFVSRLPVDGEDHDLKGLLDQVMEHIGRNFVETIQSLPGEGSSRDQGAFVSSA
jgi:hypothetical protein